MTKIQLQLPQIMLSTVIEQLESDLELAHTRRRDLLSDLRCLARLLDRHPEAIPADLKALKRRINDLHPVQVGVTKKRVQNIRSSLMFVFRRYGITKTIKAPLRRDWDHFCSLLEGKRERDGLINLIRFCNAQAIAPGEVTDEVAAAWLAWLEQESLNAKPRARHRQACVIWNEVAERLGSEVPHEIGALRPLTVPNNRKSHFTLPWEAFPLSFSEDVERYCTWQSGKELFAEHAPPRPAKPATIELRRTHIRILASAAVTEGFPIEEVQSLGVLVSQDCIRAALGYYQKKHDGQFTRYVRDLTKTLLSIARHWVRDEAQISWIQVRLRRMGSDRVGLTDKNRQALRQFDDPHNVLRLLELPEKLLVQVERSTLSPKRQAVRVQLALALALFTAAPMRLQNMARLRLDQNIHWVGRGKGRPKAAFISLPEAAVKNGVPLEYPLSDDLAAMLDRYVTEYRPAIADAGSPWLFPGQDGHKQEHTLYQQLKKLLEKETGIILTAHQFRHVAAKLYLDHNPGGYEVVRRLLGHKSLSTTTSFYTGLESGAAVRHYDETLAALRHGPEGARNPIGKKANR